MSRRRKKNRSKVKQHKQPPQPRLTDGDKAVQAAIQNLPSVLAGRKTTH